MWCPSQTVLCLAWLLPHVSCQNHIHSRKHTRLIYTTGAEFQRAGMALCGVQNTTPAPRTRWVKFKNFDLERVLSFGTLHQWCRKFLSRIFYMFWPPYGRKFRFSTFNPKTGKKSWRETLHTTGAELQSAIPALRTKPNGQNLKFLTWREYFPLELYTNGAESFSSVFFTCFDRSTAKNSDSVLSTGVQPFPYLGTFDQWCD